MAALNERIQVSSTHRPPAPSAAQQLWQNMHSSRRQKPIQMAVREMQRHKERFFALHAAHDDRPQCRS